MNYHNFDRYKYIMISAALAVALLTYWRYRAIDPASTFDYVAQESVVWNSFSLQSSAHNPVLWNFFGIVNKIIDSKSIVVLKVFSLFISVINLLMLFKLVSFLLIERFWGFIGLFLFSLSPPAVVSAVSGGPEAAALSVTLLFLYSLYQNNYLIAALLSVTALTINLPGIIYFLIVIFDILQNVQDKKKVISLLSWTALIFFGFTAILFWYGNISSSFVLAMVPFSLTDFKWNLIGLMPVILTNVLNVAGIIYLIKQQRQDVYIKHFPLLMLWLNFCAFAVAFPSSINMLNALAVSLILFLFFLQGFPLVLRFTNAMTELFVIGFVILFLSFDLMGNNHFLHDQVLSDIESREEAVKEVVSSVNSATNVGIVMSNFVPSELSVRLGRTIYAAGASVIPTGITVQNGKKIIYIVNRKFGSGTEEIPCRCILSTMYFSENSNHKIEVFVCEGRNEK